MDDFDMHALGFMAPEMNPPQSLCPCHLILSKMNLKLCEFFTFLADE